MTDHETGRFSTTTLEMLQAAGWFPGRDVSTALALPEGFSPFPAALDVLKEFGKLRIGQQGRGIEFARTPVVLEPKLAAGEQDRFAEFDTLLNTRLYPLGETADGHSFITIDEHGRIFLIFEEISYVDASFDAAIDNLLNGRRKPRIVNEAGDW